MNARLLVTGLFLSCAVSATAQLTGTFYLEKTTFAPGEPIFLYFKVSNPGKTPRKINTTALPDQPFCAGYEIKVSRIRGDPSLCSLPSFCSLNGQLSYNTIQPGATYTERILLNFDALLNLPGDYMIDVKHHDGLGDESRYLGDELVVHSTLRLRVEAGAPPVSDTIFLPWINALHSRNPREQIEAARVLASLAPLSLEDVLLGFARDPNLRRFAPLAFHRLNTSRSTAALAALLNGPRTNEQSEAALYLAETGDQKWFPLLLEKANQYANDSAFPAAAAELGGEKAIPALAAIEKSPDRKFAALNAVMAMGYTGSRAAIPYLLDFLNSPEPELAERANGSLQMLTHRTANAGKQVTPTADYQKWSQWWTREGATAPIYKEPWMRCDPLAFKPLL